MFDDMVVAQIRRLNGAWPELVAPVQFAVEDVPHYADALLARIHRTYPELHALVHSGKKLPPEALERLRTLADETLKNL